MEGDHFLLPILVREGDHNLLGGTVFGSQFWSGRLILAATFGPGGPLLGGDRISRDRSSGASSGTSRSLLILKAHFYDNPELLNKAMAALCSHKHKRHAISYYARLY